jgi:hypothetical protein
MVSDEILKLWSEHSHALVEEIMGSGYYHRAVKYCPTCQTFAKHSGIPGDLHHTHPPGCLCLTCADCRCKEVVERDTKYEEERARKRKIAELQESLKFNRYEGEMKALRIEGIKKELRDLGVEPEE